MDAAADRLMVSVSFGELARTLSTAVLEQAMTDELSSLVTNDLWVDPVHR